MIFGKKENQELEKFAEMLARGTADLFAQRGEIKLSKKPVVERKKITDYEGRMRVDGMEKFDNEPTYISAVSFYENSNEMEKGNALGVVVTYVKQDYLAKFMKKLKYPPVDDESDEELRDSCGTLCNIIAGHFKTEVSSAGYIELEMSAFVNFRNNSFSGVSFCKSEYSMYEIEFYIEDEKRIVLEISIGTVPKAK